jgi:hypothetical protein
MYAITLALLPMSLVWLMEIGVAHGNSSWFALPQGLVRCHCRHSHCPLGTLCIPAYQPHESL